MLHDGHDLGGHEAGGPHRHAGARHLGHFDRPPDVRHLDPPARPAGVDLEALHAGVDINEDFDTVAFHVSRLPTSCNIGPGATRRRDGEAPVAAGTETDPAVPAADRIGSLAIVRAS